jgi:hypothetical protein
MQSRARPDWFSPAEHTLVELVNKRNEAFKKCMKNPSVEDHQDLKIARHELFREKRRAKRKWQYFFTEKCQMSHLKTNPKKVWSMILMDGFQPHHKTNVEKNFKSKDGKVVTNDTENAEILKAHFTSLFNSHTRVDFSVLDEIPNHITQHILGEVPSKTEIKKAISKMASNKAPGKSGLTTDMIKCLPPKAMNLYVEIIQEFWKKDVIDFDSWYITVLHLLYKGKGNPHDPNNHHGIALKETSAKVLSIIIAKRLLHRLKQIGTNTQFGHIGCQEAQHVLKQALLLRHQHGLESDVIFVDLVKAFDTVHQDLLCAILKKYGAPETRVSNVAKICNKCMVNIKLGRECAEVDNTTGVHQGDNMSPILFLFVIQAFLDTLKLKTQTIKFAYFPKNKNGRAETAKGNQNTTAKGVAFELQSSFYVDDSFCVFQNRDELHEAVGILNNHFSKFRLKMHLGSDDSKSKSEAIFFPASLKEVKMQTEVPEDLTFLDGSRIHFMKSFKYLGSIITPCLNEDSEIEMRIKKAKSLMGMPSISSPIRMLTDASNIKYILLGP